MNIFKQFGLSPDIQNKFISLGNKLQLKKGDFLLKQGTVCIKIAYIVSGKLKQIHERDGNLITTSFGYEGFITDYYSFLTNKESDFSIIAISDCELLVFGKDQVESFYNYNNQTQLIGRKVAEQLLISTQEGLMSMMFDSVEERYKKYIERYPELFQMYSAKDIAQSLGTTPETLSRIRKKLL